MGDLGKKRNQKYIVIESFSQDSRQNTQRRNDDIIREYAHSLATKTKTKTLIISEDKTFTLKYSDTLTFAEFVQRFENYADNIPNSITQDFFIKMSQGQYTQAKCLVAHKDFCVNAYDTSGFTPLILAIKANCLEIIESLLTHTNLDINKRDAHHLKMTPLMHATQLGNMTIFRLLLQRGACAYLGSMGRNRGNTPFLIACWDNKKHAITMCQMLLEHNVSINQVDNNGFSGLIKASIKGHSNIIDYLLTQGADTKLRDFEAKSAIEHAREHNHTAIISLLEAKND